MTKHELLHLLKETCASAETLCHVEHILNKHKSKYIPIDEMFEYCCRCTGVTVDQAKGKSRKQEFVRTRQLFCYAGRFIYSLQEMGDCMGGRDHTTTIHNRDRAKKLMEAKDDLFVFDYDNLERLIAGLELNPTPPAIEKPPKEQKPLTLVYDLWSDLYYKSVAQVTKNFGMNPNGTTLVHVNAKYARKRFIYKSVGRDRLSKINIVE